MNHIKSLKRAALFAALLMLLPLPIMQYVGEESFYTLGAYEMFVRGIWWYQPLLGSAVPKTPLFAWMIIAVSNIIGWEHLDIAPRIVSVFSSWGAAFITFKMARRLFPRQAHAGWIAALIYLTMGEVSFWYGWLGYADATFSFFIFAAIACLWVSIEDQRPAFCFLSFVMISLAFMVKNISCYAILGIASLVLLHRYHRWHLLKHPMFVLSALLAISVPWLYQHYVIHTDANATMAVGHALDNFRGYNFLAYLKHWFTYPVLFFARAFPVTVLLLWFYWRQRQRYRMDTNLVTLIWLLTATMAPFWLSAGGSARYLIPFYGLLALLLSGFVLQLDVRKATIVFKVMVLIIIIKVPYSLAVLPYIKDWRPERDIKAVVKEISEIAQHHPIRTLDGVATIQSVAAYLDVQLPEGEYVRWDNGSEHQVYILARIQTPHHGKLIKRWRLRGDDVLLYWRP